MLFYFFFCRLTASQLSKVGDVKELLNKKNDEQTEKLRAEIAEYESKINKLKSDRTIQKNVNDKVEKVITTKEKEMEIRLKEVEEKMKSKLSLAEKNRAEMAEKAKKAREEQVIYIEQEAYKYILELYFLTFFTFFLFPVNSTELHNFLFKLSFVMCSTQ